MKILAVLIVAIFLIGCVAMGQLTMGTGWSDTTEFELYAAWGFICGMGVMFHARAG